MTSCLPDYDLIVPATLREALDLLAGSPGEWKPFAGGTDLMVLLEAGQLSHRKFFSILRLDELRGIEVAADSVSLGALTSYTEVLGHPVLASEFPLLGQAARLTGAVATQNRGTLGGNIANASPAADTPPALLVYDAELELISRSGARRVPYRAFHTGYKQMDLRPEELVARIRLPRTGRPWKSYYRKVAARAAQAISKVCFAGLLEVEDGVVRDVRIAMASVAPTVLRCLRTETALRGALLHPETVRRAQEVLAGEISPIDDLRSTRHYRLRVSHNLLEEFLMQSM